MEPRTSGLLALLLLGISFPLVQGQDTVGPGFETCKARIKGILDGTIPEWNGITKDNFARYQYFGPVAGMNPNFERNHRDNFTTLTTQGCKVLCQDPIDWYWQSNIGLTLGIISNWILPILALLAALPYDSLHGRIGSQPLHQSRPLKTLGALNNWIGSPQTALTSTLFNIHQMRKCLRETVPLGQHTVSSGYTEDKMNAYYVLSCIGQFRLPGISDKDFLLALSYGLFRPMVSLTEPESATGDRTAQQWTKQLLQELAFHLKMLRRRGVYPAFLSIFLFCVAYTVSVVLAFANGMGERTTAHSLAFGILLSWLPLLVLFAIIDRNPVSADRSRKLIVRWLWNVDAVRRWEVHSMGITRPGQLVHPALMPKPEWWTQYRENNASKTSRRSFDRFVKEFAGQGRQVGYNGLAYAVINSAYNEPGEGRMMQSVEQIATTIGREVEKRPGPWWVLSVTSLAIVWLEIGMAIMISYNTPTVGLACRSGSYVIYGITSSVTWVLHLFPGFKRPGTQRKAVCHFFNFLATLALMGIIFAAVSFLHVDFDGD